MNLKNEWNEMTFFDPYFERDIEDSLIIVFFIYYSSNPQKY